MGTQNASAARYSQPNDWQRPILPEEFTPELVSVVIPSHNRAALLPSAIASIQAQSYAQWEIVLADDGSTDGTEALVRELVDKRQLTYLRGERLGAQGARNLAMSHCRGEFIQFLDSDDMLHPEKIELQVDWLRNDASLDFTIGSAIWTDRPESHPTNPRVPPPPMPICIENLRGALCVTPAPLFRSASLRAVGRWDTDLSFFHESNFFGRALAHGLVAEYQADALAYARTHPSRLSNALAQYDVLVSGTVAYDRVRRVAHKNTRKVHPQLMWAIYNDRANIAVIEGDRKRVLKNLREAKAYHASEFAGPLARLWLRQILIGCFGTRIYRSWWMKANTWGQHLVR